MVARPSKEMKLENPDLSQCSSIAEDNVIPLTAAFLPSLILNGLHRIPLLLALCFFLAVAVDGAKDGVEDEAKLDKTLFLQTEGLHLHCDSHSFCLMATQLQSVVSQASVQTQ